MDDQVLTIPQMSMRHEVVATDTIDYILRKYDMTLDELIKLNENNFLELLLEIDIHALFFN